MIRHRSEATTAHRPAAVAVALVAASLLYPAAALAPRLAEAHPAHPPLVVPGVEVGDVAMRLQTALARCEGLSLDRRDLPGGGVALRAMGGNPASRFAEAHIEVATVRTGGGVSALFGGGRGVAVRRVDHGPPHGAAERDRLRGWLASPALSCRRAG